MRYVLLLVAGVVLAGCDTNKSSIVGPSAAPRVETPALLPDGSVNWRKYQVVYTSCGTFTLDYPADFIGPVPAYHARIGTDPSTLCDGYMVYQPGDPTADE